MLDLALTSDQEQLVATVREFCSREFAPTIAADDRAGRHDPEIFAKLASIGLPGVCFPQRYGGYGLDYLSLGLVCEELEYVDTVYRTVLSVHVGLVGAGRTAGRRGQSSAGWARWRGREARVLRPHRANAARTSLMRATPVTTAGLRANGQKIWVSDADTADFLLVFAKTDPKAGYRGVSAFMLDREACGNALRTEPIEDRLGIRAGDVGSIFMSDLEVGEADRIGDEGDGFKIAMSCLDNGRYTVAAGATGTVRACLDASVKYARERKTFGQEIGRYQLVQQMIAKMSRDYEICRLLYFKVAWMKNTGKRHTRQVSMSKRYDRRDSARRTTRSGPRRHYSAEYPVERFLPRAARSSMRARARCTHPQNGTRSATAGPADQKSLPHYNLISRID